MRCDHLSARSFVLSSELSITVRIIWERELTITEHMQITQKKISKASSPVRSHARLRCCRVNEKVGTMEVEVQI